MYALNFAISSNVSDSKDLSEQSLNLVNLYLSTKRKLTHLDKELKHRFYFYVFFLISFCSLFFLFCFLNTQLKNEKQIILSWFPKYIYYWIKKFITWLFIETHFNGLQLKNGIALKNIVVINPNILYILCHK